MSVWEWGWAGLLSGPAGREAGRDWEGGEAWLEGTVTLCFRGGGATMRTREGALGAKNCPSSSSA